MGSISDTVDIQQKINFGPNTTQHLWCGRSNSCGDLVPEFLHVVHLANRPIHCAVDITRQEEIERCQIRGPWWPRNWASPSNPPTREPHVQRVTNDVAIMGRSTIMLKNFNSFFLQLWEGINLKHIKVGGSINSSLRKKKGGGGPITLLWSKQHQTMIFTVMDMLDNFFAILSSQYVVIVTVYHTIGMESGFIHENNFQKICILC
jgi:hypothetical protein